MAERKGIKNLVPQSERTKDEQREIARNGGVKSGQVRREKKAMREMAQLVLAAPVPVSKALSEQLQQFGFESTEANIQLMSLLAIAKNAAKGDINALVFLRDTGGEKPTDKTELSGRLNSDINITIGGTEDDD